MTEAECREIFERIIAGCRYAPERLRSYEVVAHGLDRITVALLATFDDFEKALQRERSN